VGEKAPRRPKAGPKTERSSRVAARKRLNGGVKEKQSTTLTTPRKTSGGTHHRKEGAQIKGKGWMYIGKVENMLSGPLHREKERSSDRVDVAVRARALKLNKSKLSKKKKAVIGSHLERGSSTGRKREQVSKPGWLTVGRRRGVGGGLLEDRKRGGKCDGGG